MPSVEDKALVGGTKSQLKELLVSSRNLPKTLTDIGPIHLGLSAIQRKAHNLRKYKDDNQRYTRAHYLLAGSGISAEEIETDLLEISVPQTLDVAMGQKNYAELNNGIDTYIESKKEENILAAIEQSLTMAAKDFDAYVAQNISMDWNQRKKELRESFDIILNGTSQEPSNELVEYTQFGNASKKFKSDPNLTWSVNKPILANRVEFNDVEVSSTPTNVLNPSVSYAMRQKFEEYAQAIYELNAARQNNKPYELTNVFAQITKQANDIKSRQLYETWKILYHLVDFNEPAAFQERKFVKGHDSEVLDSFEAIALRKRIIERSRSYLEQQFMDYIDSIYIRLSNKEESKPNAPETPIVDNITKVKLFVEHRYKKEDTWKIQNLLFINGLPIWAIIFYLLRAGCLDDALNLTLKNSDSFTKVERSFPTFLKAYVNSSDRGFNQELHGRLINEFNQFFKHMNKDADPFRYAVYKLISRCELSRKNLPFITLSVEDWLWVHFTLCREGTNDDDPIYERYSLLDLQKTVLKLGPDNFNGSFNNPLYLQTLIFTGLYEHAVQYFYSISEIDSVHLAIALYYCGILRSTSDKNNTTQLLTYRGERNIPEINFARLIGTYTRTFKISDPRVAVEYLILICLGGDLPGDRGKEQIDLGLSSIRELVLETREFSLLLGKIDREGFRVPGIIEERKNLLHLPDKESFLRKITEQAAIKADDEGRVFDSLLLYQLSENYDTVISLINKLLGDLLASTDLETAIDTPAERAAEGSIIALAERLMKQYNSSTEISGKVLLKHRETCSLLLKMVECRDLFVKQEWEKALKQIGQLDMLPIVAGVNVAAARSKVEVFNSYDESVAKNVPDLLVMTLTCIAQLTYQLTSSEFNGLVKSDKIKYLKEVSRNCMLYAGILQYKMPRETYSMLVSLESML
ncbi:BA75_03921T0 [Komagataella pastoris]|uniref:Nuclear pore protein n=1 Tax=Komagataella pastoris TaxID=4922 RepID=A0A1B2JGH3_PICPA|nr:BA75_03921T0 [Komagataella pastoris]